MTTPRLGTFGILAASIPLFMLAGCYTQFATRGDERDLDYSSTTGEYADSTTQEEYEDARQSFYDDSYYPAIGIGLGYGWGYPWFGYRGYYDPFYEYGGYYRASPFGWYQPNGYFGGYHAVGRGRRGPTRTIGSTRTMGVSRSPVESTSRVSTGSMSFPPGLRSRSSSPAVGGGNRVSVTKPGVSTGRRGAAGTRSTGGRGGSRIESRPYDQSPRPAPAPTQGSGRTDAGNRGTAQPTYTPPPAPPPSAAPPSSGGRGSEDRGSSSGGSERGGSRR